ncbi:MAG: hypothetical protein DI539_20720 [Flavobacterium psychrophilum]|nr:MAG: hypothetical protein DI539_20720 [Flavobacterium psychrophilum]
MFAGLIACSTEDAAVKAQNGDAIKIDKSVYVDTALKSLSKSSSNYLSPILYSYSDTQDAAAQNAKAMEGLAAHYYDQLSNGPGTTIMKISSTVGNNLAVMNGITYADTDNGLVLDVIEYNPIKGIFEPIAVFPPYQAVFSDICGGCDEGFTEIGSSSYTTPEQLAMFMAQVASDYLIDNAAPGYDINLSYKFGKEGMVICAQKVKKY